MVIDSNRLAKSAKWNFLIIYLITFVALFGVISFMYYKNQIQSFVNLTVRDMQQDLKKFEEFLKINHQDFNSNVKIDTVYEVNLFDSDKVKIFSEFENSIDFSKSFYYKDGFIFAILELKNYFLGVKYVAFRAEISNQIKIEIIKNIFFVFSFAIFFISIVAIYLSKLVIKPYIEFNNKIDEFIKNTVHELNTPISTISASCEYFDKSNLNEKQKRALKRILIGAKTLNSLYQDLIFISFYSNLDAKIEKIDLKNIITQRVQYFEQHLELKNISIELDLGDVFLEIDKEKFVRVVDNLLSNAIKYNKNGGFIKICLRDNNLSIKDSGIGIDENKQKLIFERFKRVSEFGGGFGIGLDLVSKIAYEFNIKIELHSKLNEGSEFILSW